jgi:hypothetical protein
MAHGRLPVASLVRPAPLSAAAIQRLSQDANSRVMIIFHNQSATHLNGVATAATREAAVAGDQGSVLNELTTVHATGVRAFHLINAIGATVSAAEATRLATFPQVQAVIPDAVIQGPAPLQRETAPVTAASTSHACSGTPELDPEALQLTNTAFSNPATPQAQSLVTGKGVTVAFLADGLDINNPDFIRSDGSSVFVDYEDFSGDGVNAPTAGGEAFGDASSIAAQGRTTYNVGSVVNAAHPVPGGCLPIRIEGMAPGASLMGLKIFGQTNDTFNSNFVQAIQYAVDHGANVINESFGGNPFPDNSNDPISLADNAAVAAGVTVVVSTGDGGTAHTIGSPATDPNVISAGATTAFRLYSQVTDYGFQLGSGGYLDNNISSLSSGGPAQSGRQTVDVVAPGDLNWALCSTDVAMYADCRDFNGNPTPIQDFGGTSESAPLTAGEAALVIQAYSETHGGALPSPALVKTIITSTADDLGLPSYEQGAGLIDSYRAVQAAMSYQDSWGSPTPQGHTLLVSPSTLSATANPGATDSFPVQVTNTGATAETVQPRVRQLDAPFNSSTQTLTIAPTIDPTFTDGFGTTAAYITQPFTVPAGTSKLDAAIAWNVVSQPVSIARLSLFDPLGRMAAYTLPQGAGNGYGHVDVRAPTAGTWKAVIWTRENGGVYQGPVQLTIAESHFLSVGQSTPSSLTLQPGQTGTFNVQIPSPLQPGDQNDDLVVYGMDASNVQTLSGAVPIILRTLVPVGPNGGSFSGTITGGNGRPGAGGETLTYAFDVPGGMKDLDLNTTIADSNYNLEGILETPDGRPIDVQSTITAVTPLGVPTAYTNTMQFFSRNPAAGRWQFVLLLNDTISGSQTSLPFNATITFNGVRVQATLPNSAAQQLPAGSPVTAQVTVTNTGNTTKDFFVDPRLRQYGTLSLGGYLEVLPINFTEPPPLFYVPPESTSLSIVAESTDPTTPLNMDIENANGASPDGGTGSPDIEATPFFDPVTGDYGAAAGSEAPEVVPGLWYGLPTEIGPYAATGAMTSTVLTAGDVNTQQFDTTVSSSTGDPYGILTGVLSGPYTPLTLAPGATGTITVSIIPAGSTGTAVLGTLYVDALNQNSTTSGLITGIGDELVAIPYAYTVGAATPTATNTPVPATNTPTHTPVPATNTPTRTPVPATSTSTSTPVPATSTSTSTPVPATNTPTRTPVPATNTPTHTPVPATNTSTATSTALPVTSTPTPTKAPASATPTSTRVPAASGTTPVVPRQLPPGSNI